MTVDDLILTKDKVVWTKDLAEGTGPHGVHCARLQVHQHCTGDIFATWRLQTSRHIKSIITSYNFSGED